MPEKDPSNYTIMTYAWVFVLSSWGGAVSFYRKIQSGAARPWNIAELLGEILTSVFAGIVTFYLCEAGGIDGPMQAALVAISGHMGSRAIFIFENWASKKWGS